jgi:hypothetical protein
LAYGAWKQTEAFSRSTFEISGSETMTGVLLLLGIEGEVSDELEAEPWLASSAPMKL